MSVHATVFEVNPETGELSDKRDMPTVVSALLRRAHPQLADIREREALRTTTGCLAVVDPIAHLHKQPLSRRAPKGEHPVSLCMTQGGEVGAVLVSFAQGEVASVERATWVWPFADAVRYGVESGLVALFDYNEVNELDPIRTERLSLLSSLPPDVSGALVSLPRVRKWNAVVCRPAPDGNHFYSAHWALNAGGATLALILDFAAFA
jgi:hypothetical protein